MEITLEDFKHAMSGVFSTSICEATLDESEWQELLQRVRAGEEFTEASKTIETLPPPFKEDLLRVSNLNILKGALCQNHLKGFAIMAAILFALVLQFKSVGRWYSRTINPVYRSGSHQTDTFGNRLVYAGHSSIPLCHAAVDRESRFEILRHVNRYR